MKPNATALVTSLTERLSWVMSSAVRQGSRRLTFSAPVISAKQLGPEGVIMPDSTSITYPYDSESSDFAPLDSSGGPGPGSSGGPPPTSSGGPGPQWSAVQRRSIGGIQWRSIRRVKRGCPAGFQRRPVCDFQPGSFGGYQCGGLGRFPKDSALQCH